MKPLIISSEHFDNFENRIKISRFQFSIIKKINKLSTVQIMMENSFH